MPWEMGISARPTRRQRDHPGDTKEHCEGTDLLLTAGAPPLIRVDGEMRSVEGGECPVLGVDSIVVCEGRRFGKPDGPSRPPVSPSSS